MIFSDESNYEVLNRSNRRYLRRLRTDRTHFERLNKRTHRGGGLSIWSFIMCDGSGPLIVLDGCLNSFKYIDLLEEHLSTALKRFPKNQLNDIMYRRYQQDNARPHLSKMTLDFFKKKHVKQFKWLANNPDLNIIKNLWSMIDYELLKLSINNLNDLKKRVENALSEIFIGTIEKSFQSISKLVRDVIDFKGF